MKNQHISTFITIFLFIYLLFKTITCIANPIPVFPDPQPDYISPVAQLSSDQGIRNMIPFVFLIDFALNLFIIYIGFIVLIKIRQYSIDEFNTLSRYQFLITAIIISIIGITLEIILGTWIIGLFIIIIIVILSYYITCIKIFNITKKNGSLIALLAGIINTVSWFLFYLFT